MGVVVTVEGEAIVQVATEGKFRPSFVAHEIVVSPFLGSDYLVL